ncbi:MAG: hypothetical protein QN168_07805 [Armatimonadota bacterium]|nr:hypothetical protein [Armatimonadota bacterium]
MVRFRVPAARTTWVTLFRLLYWKVVRFPRASVTCVTLWRSS